MKSFSRKPKPDFALFQKIYKVYKIILSKYAKLQPMTLESHKNQHKHNKTTLAYLENNQEQPRSLRKIKFEWCHNLAYQTTSSKLQKPSKKLQE